MANISNTSAKIAEKKIRKYIAGNGAKLMTAMWVLLSCTALALLGALTASVDYRNILLYLAGVFGAFTLIFLVVSANINGGAAKSIKALKASGELERAAAELDAVNSIVLGDNKGLATEHYLAGRNTGSILRYEDILLFYPSAVTNNGQIATNFIAAYTADREKITAVNLGPGDASQVISIIVEKIKNANPDVIYGFSKELLEEYRKLRKSLKDKAADEVSQ